MPLEPGVRLGTFEILGPLGAGGMGEVYRARDTRLGRDVAIKVLPEAFAREETHLGRFEREARLLAAVNHPAIAAIYGAEESGSIRYIIMELVPGETLAEKIARGPLPIEESLRLCHQIAEGLEAAHESGVVHRDLKPSNIKVTPDGKAKVLDLGLAKFMQAPAAAAQSNSPTLVAEQTRPGVILGTVEFMSPEQARGKGVDKRTDIWAFGCILFELLSGRRAFTGETISDTLAAILTGEPDWSALPSSVPPRIRELLARCLEKDVNRRLRDIGDARIEINNCLAGGESASLPETRSIPRRRWRRIAAAAGAALVLAGGVWVGIFSSHRRANVPDRKFLAVLPFRDLSGRPGGQLVGDGLAETLSVRLARLPGVQVVTPMATMAGLNKQSDPYRLARELGANLILRGAVQREGERLRFTYSVLNVSEQIPVTGDDVTGSASELFAMQDKLAESVAGALKLPREPRRAAPPPGLETASEQERYIQAVGYLLRYDKQASVDEAIRQLEGLAAERPSSALVQAALVRAYLARHNLTREKTWAEKAIAAFEKARRLDPSSPETDVTLGELAVRTGKPAEAIVAFRRALAAQPENFFALLGLARAYDLSGEPVDADAAYRRAIRLQPSYWFGYSKLGGSLFARGRYAEAAEMFRRITELQPDNARAFSNLGAAYHQMDRYEDALAAFRTSLGLERTANAYSNAGTTEFFLGRYRDAAEDFQKAVTLTPEQHEAWVNLADSHYWAQGERQQALEAYRRAIELLRAELELNPQNALARARLAVCLARSGQNSAAGEEIRKAVALAAQHPQVLYDAAIVAQISGNRGEAIRWIGKAVAAGFGVRQMRREPEFAGLQKEKAFQEALETGQTRS